MLAPVLVSTVEERIVEETSLLPVSASQIDTFRDCARKWAWQKIEGLQSPPNAAAQLGTLVHAKLEKYLTTGFLDDSDRVGSIAAAGLQHLPRPKTVAVEEYFEITSPNGLYRGYMDAHWVEDKVSYVLDHKTTSDFKWMKTEEILKTDVQANIYAAAAMLLDNTAVVHQRWVYYLTSKAPRSKISDIVVYRSDVEPLFEQIDATVGEMHQIKRAKKRALDLAPSPQTCMKYGGCPFVANCNLTTQELTRSVFMQMSLADKLKAKLNAPKPETTEAAPAVTPAAASTAPAAAAAKPARASAPRINSPKLASDPAASAAVDKAVESISQGMADAMEAAVAATLPAKSRGTSAAKEAQLDRRDLFAANALQGLLARGQHANLGSPQGLASLVSLSFEIADEMLKAG